jgi:hypothetical protein
MSGRIISLPIDPHREALSLLPWYVRGRLDPEEHARLEAHLTDCAECRAELRFENRLNVVLHDPPPDPEQGWARIERRIRGLNEDPQPSAHRLRRRAAAPPWVGWAFAAQVLLMVLGGGVLVAWLGPDRYHTLSSPSPTSRGDLVVIFSPEISEESLRAILRTNHARIIDGPSAPGAYVLATPKGQRDAILARLRGDPHLLLAEPLDNSPSP